MTKTQKSLLKNKSKSSKGAGKTSTKKKRVTINIDNNKEKIIERLYNKENIPDLWFTSEEKQLADSDSINEEIKELGEYNYYSKKRDRKAKREKHIEDILSNVNKEIRLRKIIPKLAANEARIKLKMDDDGSPRITLKRSKSSRWGGSKKSKRKN